MRTIAFLLALVCLMPHSAWAIHGASKASFKAIDEQLDRAYSIQHFWKDSQGNDVSIDETMRKLNFEKGLIDQNGARIAELERHMESLKRDRDLARSKAIHLTLVAYGVVPEYDGGKPAMPSGTVVHPSFAGKQATWIAVAGENAPRPVITPKGEEKEIPKAVELITGKEPDGVTFPDGVTMIFPQFFEERDAHGHLPSVEALAALLIHEQRHFVQFTTPGQGDKMTWYERELAAHKADLSE